MGTADAWLWLWRAGRQRGSSLCLASASGRSISHRWFWWRVGMSGLWGRSHRTASWYCNIVATLWWWDNPEPFLTGTDLLLLHRVIHVRGWLWGSSDISGRLLLWRVGGHLSSASSHGRFHTPQKPRRDSLGNGLGNGNGSSCSRLQVAFRRHGRW